MSRRARLRIGDVIRTHVGYSRKAVVYRVFFHRGFGGLQAAVVECGPQLRRWFVTAAGASEVVYHDLEVAAQAWDVFADESARDRERAQIEHTRSVHERLRRYALRQAQRIRTANQRR